MTYPSADRRDDKPMTDDRVLQLVRLADPLPDDMPGSEPDELLRRLIEPVPLPDAKVRRRPVTRRPALIAGLTAAVFAVATGVAFANDVNPLTRIAAFVGLTAADRAQTSQDVLDPAIVAQLDLAEEDTNGGRQPFDPAVSRGEIVRDSIRFLKELPSGRSLYLATTTTHRLILILLTDDGELSSAAGVPPLPERDPVTVAMIGGGIGGPPLGFSFGIAQDGVTSVSFVDQPGGSEQTVPVMDNVWAHEGYSRALEGITVHYADGTSQTVRHPNYPCVTRLAAVSEAENLRLYAPIWCASGPTHVWFRNPNSSGAKGDTNSWSVMYFDGAAMR
jgi:hypothetical protein